MVATKLQKLPIFQPKPAHSPTILTKNTEFELKPSRHHPTPSTKIATRRLSKHQKEIHPNQNNVKKATYLFIVATLPPKNATIMINL